MSFTSPKRAWKFIHFLGSNELWVVAPVIGASVIKPQLLLFAFIIALVFWIIRFSAYRRLSIRTPADFAIAAHSLMIPVTLWATALPEKTHPQALRLLTGIALYYAIVNWMNSRNRLNVLLIGITLIGLLLALMAPLSVEWSIGKLPFIPTSLYERFTLLVTDTIHTNVIAGNLVIILPIAVCIFLFGFRELRWHYRIFSLMTILCITAVLVLTQSRGAWIAFAAVFMVLLPLLGRWGWLGLPLAGIAAGLAAYYIGIQRVIELVVSSNTLGSLEGRLEVWSRAIFMIQDFSFTGVGLGTYGDVADVLYPFFLAAPGSIPHAHNLFLQVAVDLGIPGLISWLAILLLAVVTSWQIYIHGRKTNQHLICGLGAGLLCSQVALVVHGLTDAVVWGMVRPAPLVWGIWGMAAAGLYVCVPSGA